MTQDQFKKQWNRLSFWRQEWVRAKAQWERCSLWAVLESWSPPTTRECERMLKPMAERPKRKARRKECAL